MQIGRSTASWAARIMLISSSGSSTSGIPALMSSTSAPACAWAIASAVTVLRSPPRSCSANSLRPVGLIRSPMMQNGCSEPTVTVLERDRSTVSIEFPFNSGRNAQACTQLCDAGVPAERDEMKAAHAGLLERVRGQLAGELEALRLGVRRLLDPGHGRRRDVDPGNPGGDESHPPDGAQDADRGDDRQPLAQPTGAGLAHEALEQLRAIADLQLQEAGAGERLLRRLPHPGLVRRGTRI